MAEIKCPKCGKLNPSFADTCMDCQNPLPPATPPESNGEETPDWLKRIRERTGQEQESKPPLEEPVAPFAPGDLPDWLKELKEEKINKDIPPAVEQESESEEDWLEKLRTSPVYQKESPQTAPLPETPGEKQEASLQLWGPGNGGEIPDWLKAATRPGEKILDDFVFPKAEETHPDDITAPISLTEHKPNPFVLDSENQPPHRIKEEADFLTGLAGSSETSGQEPLPFIPQTLEAQPYSPDFFQTSALTNRIQLSEKQHLNVGLLKAIISTEGEPKPVFQTSSEPEKPLGRLAIIIGILLVLLGLVAFMPIPSALPQLYPIEVADVFNQISTLPENSPVLIAVDYDPALAGEMQLSSSSLLGHLMTRSARLAFISTRPTGPMLADSLVSTLLPGQPQFPSSDHLVNLGYLPGDAAGLRTFARQPGLSTPYTSGLKLAWDSPALQGINLLSDFSAVIVITDNAEVMRNWVEQVQPTLGQSPLFVVLSAQAGPLIQPYYESNQVQGGLSGLLGGAMYSQILGRTGFADSYLNAFQIGAFIAVLAILGGGLFQLLSTLFSRKTSGEGE
ncbi:MAG: hypothetical protein AB9891_09690 [Anaerolineaceae bacterium]